MKNELIKYGSIAWAVLATVVAVVAVTFLFTGAGQSGNSNSSTKTAVTRTSSSKAKTKTTKTKASTTSTASSTDDGRDSQNTLALGAEATKFTRTVIEFKADQGAKRDAIAKMANDELAAKLVPSTTKITNKSLLKQQQYTVDWDEITPMVQPGTGTSRTVTVHIKYSTSLDPDGRTSEYLVYIGFKNGHVDSYDYYQVVPSQSSEAGDTSD